MEKPFDLLALGMSDENRTNFWSAETGGTATRIHELRR